jgi:diguanylate cyclase (GGDEF)-like protein/PAS domain S-box-containing protein
MLFETEKNPTDAPLEPAASAENPQRHALRNRLANLERALNLAPVGLCVLDLEFRYVAVNRQFAEMYGLAESDFIGRSVTEVLPEPAPQILAHLRQTLLAESVVEREIVLTNPTKSRRDDPGKLTYLRTAQCLRDDDGLVVGIAVALLDITQRKRLSAALHESEEDLRYTVELTPHIPWTADPSGVTTSISPRWATITGIDPSGDLAHMWDHVLHPDEQPAAQHAWIASVKTGAPYDVEGRMRIADGSWRWFRARAYPRRAENGQIVRWYGTIEDIHERKTTAMRLASVTEELARRVIEDYLTCLPNRRRFDEVLGHEIRRARRTRQPLALILLDIDHFKRYNDLCGHLAGDECLKLVARAIESVIRRPADLAARFGGEEFAIVLPETSFEGALELAERARLAVAALSLRHIDPRIGRISVSAGVALLGGNVKASKRERMNQLIEAADAELYAAKKAGRNQVHPGPKVGIAS